MTGGLTPKNIDHILGQDSEFMKAYKDKGRVSGLLETIPLFAVMEEDLGVRGAKHCCILEYERISKSIIPSGGGADGEMVVAKKTGSALTVLGAVAAASIVAGIAVRLKK